MQDTLRFIMCGSVDDGKSTLIGRLLWETKQVYEDQLTALKRDSNRYGTQGDNVDFALLVDGLQAERNQSITIDVAYRFFATPRRRFVVADTPGHEQYTHNMATGASTSDVAVLVVNAGKGLQIQTLRHARIAFMLGIRHLVLAVNKMDEVDWNESVFNRIVQDFEAFAHALGFDSLHPIPISALHGTNITEPNSAASWYRGPTLLATLEGIDVSRGADDLGFRMSVQWVNRPNQNFRGYCGRIASGRVKVGDRVCVLPGGFECTVRSIIVWKQELPNASTGDSITLCLGDEIDVTRGNVISSASDPAGLSDQFEAQLLWLSEESLIAGRSYLFHLHTCQAVAIITKIKHKIDIMFGTSLAARALGVNDIGVVHLSIDRIVPFETYDRCKSLGSFILIDRLTNQTVGAGMISFALRRAANLRWQLLDIKKEARSHHKLQRPICLWFTGLSGAGKSTVANLLEKRMFAAGRHTYTLDGDNIRHGLCRDLGFSEADRVENIRRAMEVARLFVDAGLIVIVSFISPYRAERNLARSRFEPGEFVEIYVDTPLEECERRDPKGLYAKARRGELLNFTGIDSRYEPPEFPELRLDTTACTPEECVDLILSYIESKADQK